MNRYVLEDKIGEGTFGIVYRAKKKGVPGKRFAVKKLNQRFSSWQDVTMDREFNAIVVLGEKKKQKQNRSSDNEMDHSDYVVRTIDICRENDDCLYFVMELMVGGSLHDYIIEKFQRLTQSPVSVRDKTGRYKFDESETRSILFQAFRGLCHVHTMGFLHRDIKPENILLNGRNAKLSDFSLARPIQEHTNIYHDENDAKFNGSYSKTDTMLTDYIGTRWYRGPELLNHNGTLNDRQGSCYTKAIDVFSMGCVVAELYRCSPLFQGRDDLDQFKLIKELLLFDPLRFDTETVSCMSFSEGQSPESLRLPQNVVRQRLEHAVPTADHRAIALLHSILQICPQQRPTSEEVLRHLYFDREYYESTLWYEKEQNPILRRFSRLDKKKRPSVLVSPVLDSPSNILEFTNSNEDYAFIEDSIISEAAMSPKFTFERNKRQKLRPSQIFNID